MISGIQANSAHVTRSRLALLSARPAVTFPVSERRRTWPVPIYTVL